MRWTRILLATLVLILLSTVAHCDAIVDFIMTHNPQVRITRYASVPILGDAKVDLYGRYTYGERSYETLGGEELDVAPTSGRQEAWYQVGIRATIPLISPKERKEKAKEIADLVLRIRNEVVEAIQTLRTKESEAIFTRRTLETKRKELNWMRQRVDAGVSNLDEEHKLVYEVLKLEEDQAKLSIERAMTIEKLLGYVPRQERETLKELINEELKGNRKAIRTE